MGIEFRLGAGDHKVAEDFLATNPGGVSAIILGPRAGHREEAVAGQARDAGIEVHWDPATDRLTRPGFQVPTLSQEIGILDVGRLRADTRARVELVRAVHRAQPPFLTTAAAPHVVAESREDWALNLDLASRFADTAADGVPVRPTLILSSRLKAADAEEIAAGYRAEGFDQVELRITPFGGEDEGARKIRAAYALARAFKSAGLEVTLGCSGTLGQIAIATEAADRFSVGIGVLERVNHAASLARQQKERAPGRGFRAQCGTYFGQLAYTAPVKLGKGLLSTPRLRSRIGCHIGACGSSVAGIAADPRAHYLHARAHEVDLLLSRPGSWRANGELDRLRRALTLRKTVNAQYLPEGAAPIKTRMLAAAVGLLAESGDEAITA